MGGIFAQTLTFGLFGVAMALAYDRTNGAVDRFRSLPIPRSSFLAGHSLAGLLRSLLPIVLMSIAGLIVGWRIHSSVPEAFAGYLLMIGWSFAMVWVGVLLAAAMRTPEGVQGVAFVFVFPITFVASTFVPVDTLPPVLRTIAEWNPVTAIAGALRQLFDNPGQAIPPDSPWPIHHPIPYAVIWTVLIIAVCAPLATRMYQRSIAS